MEEKCFKFNLQLFAEEGDGGQPENQEKGASDQDVKTVPYERFSEVLGKSKEKDATITALQEQMKKFEGYVPADELEKTKKEYEGNYSKQLEQLKIQSKLETKLVAEGLSEKYLELVMKTADLSKLSIQNDKIIGLDDVAGMLKTNYSELFGTKTPLAVNNAGAGAGGIPPAQATEEEKLKKIIFAAAGLKQ